MLNAKKIEEIIPEGGAITLNFRKTAEGKLCVVVDPQFPKKDRKNLSGASEAIKSAISKRVITATSKELDEGFMELLETVVEKRSSLESQLDDLETSAAEAVKKAKEEAAKKSGKKATKKETKQEVKKEESTPAEKPMSLFA